MNQEIKQQWLAALRSGQYQQTFGALRMDATPIGDGNFIPGGYCVGGILCDLHAQATGTTWERATGAHALFHWTYLTSPTALMPAVREWAGLEDVNVIIMLADSNDRGETFEELAKRIEEML